ncbi:MAG TPA: hypothetical protein VIJ46_02385 [Rhabdochlamydiaceae bacterium]
MTTAVTLDTGMSTQNMVCVPASLTTKEVEGKIGSFDATQIETLANALAAKVMSRLNIDVIRNAPVAGETYPDVEGGRHQVYFDQYDPESKMLRVLAPEIAKQITRAFSTPVEFVQKGVTLRFIGSGGLLDQVKSQDPFLRLRITEGETCLKHQFDLNSVSYDLMLSVNLDQSRRMSDLYFAIDTFVNGAKIGNTGNTLQGFEKQASQRVVH